MKKNCIFTFFTLLIFTQYGLWSRNISEDILQISNTLDRVLLSKSNWEIDSLIMEGAMNYKLLGETKSLNYKLNRVKQNAKKTQNEHAELLCELTYLQWRWHVYKTDNYLQSIVDFSNSKLSQDPSLKLQSTFLICQNFFATNQYAKGFQKLVELRDLLEEHWEKKIYAIDKYAHYVSVKFMDFEDHAAATTWLEKVLSANISLRPYYLFHLYNSLGLGYKAQKKYSKALLAFQKAEKLSHLDTVYKNKFVGLISGNIGKIYFLQKNYALARYYLNKGQDFCEKNDLLGSASSDLLELAEIDKLENDNEGAIKKIFKAADLVKKSGETHRNKGVFKQLFWAYKTMGKNELAALYADTLVQYFEEEEKQFLSSYSKQAELTNQNEKLKLQAEKEIESRKNQKLIKNFAIVICLLLLIVLLFYYQYQKSQKEVLVEKQKVLEIQTHEAQMQIDRASARLQNFLETIKTKNRELFEITQENRQLKDQMTLPEVQENRTSTKLNLIKKSILKEEDWTEFKVLFEQLHPGFIQNLNKKYDNLTKSEERLLTLAKLGMGDSEMAEMLGISPESVQKTRYRMRKKLNTKEDLHHIVSEI